MSEWHITPDYIVNNWTDELFELMAEKFVERRRRETDGKGVKRNVPVDMLALKSSNFIKVERN